MKLFKKPFFAVVLCLLLIVGATCLNVKVKMEKRYDRICDRLYGEVLEYAEQNGYGELKALAHEAAASGDYRALIAAFSVYSSGPVYSGADDVDDEIRSYTKFLRSTQQFPARIFVDLLKIEF